jgi:5-methylcytosine-specific restriction endonuclease McrA
VTHEAGHFFGLGEDNFCPRLNSRNREERRRFARAETGAASTFRLRSIVEIERPAAIFIDRFPRHSAAKTWMRERVSVAGVEDGLSFVFAEKTPRAAITRAKSARRARSEHENHHGRHGVMQSLANRSDDALLHELHVIVSSHRRVTAELILHLGEVNARRIHVEKGFSSLFNFCVAELRFSEDEACRRIEAARLARRFPAIYPLLQTGAVSLTVLGLLKPHLTDENHRELLAGVSGSSVRQAREWLAARFPRPDVPSTIRKRAERCPTRAMLAEPAAAAVFPTESALNGAELTLRATAGGGQPASTQVRVEPLSQDLNGATLILRPAPPASARARVEPLSQDRFLVKFTASRAMKEKVELASDLMRHANPEGELAVVLERALDLLIAELEKRKQGRTTRPQKRPRSAKDTQVTRAARREVVERDGWRCSFVADDGRRCDARAFLEFDHEIPKGRGGGSQAENLRLLCRAHNRREAERVYGKAHVSRAISGSRRKTGKTLIVRETLLSYYGERPGDPNAMSSWNASPPMHSASVWSPLTVALGGHAGAITS